MKVQNLMEEYVYSRVNELYEKLSENKPSWLSCTCESCRLDVVTYVLNKVHPLYVVSGRGVTYSSQAVDSQVKADVDALVLEGIRTVAGNVRPEHQSIAKEKIDDSIILNTPAFNFPVITGTVLNGTTFEPLDGASIVLKDQAGNALMQDPSWDNPCRTYKSTKGNFAFWPAAVPATRPGLATNCHFILEVSAQGYNPVTCVIEIPVVSSDKIYSKFDSTLTLKVKDLYLFKN